MNWKKRYNKVKTAEDLIVGRKYELRTDGKKDNSPLDYIITIKEESNDFSGNKGFTIMFLFQDFNDCLFYSSETLNGLITTSKWLIKPL